jgi:arylsulfate sulfotransferase
MQQKHKGWGVSILPNAHRRNAGFAPAPKSITLRSCFALSLASICPLALFAANNQPVAANPPRVPAPPSTTTHGGATAPGFSFHVSARALQLVVGGEEKDLDVQAVADTGFKGAITVKVDKLPEGIAATPASFKLAPGARQAIHFSALSNIARGTSTIVLSAVSGAVTHNAPVSVKVTPSITTATLSTFFFDFGDNLVGNKLVHTAVVVTNTGTSTLTMNPSLAGNPGYSIVTQESCGAQLAAGKSCDMVLRYVPTQPSYPHAQQATLNLNFGNAAAGVPGSVVVSGVSAMLRPGEVTPTNNPQVALYTMTLPFPGRMRVQFGESKTYGTNTWIQSTDTNNGQVSIFVAGMKASTTYHMAASVQFSNGIAAMDSDHTFKTGALPASMQMNLTATTTKNMTPQPGIEFTNPLTGLAMVDLSGNIIWTYPLPPAPTPVGNFLDGAKMLPNGDILMVLAPGSNKPLGHLNLAQLDNVINEIREINLAGDTVKELSIGDLNSELANAPSSCVECKGLQVATFHHDVTPLPNGHWLLLTSYVRVLGPHSAPPLTNSPQKPVLGDAIIDVDQNLQPVWAWSEFNHLDPNRHPWVWPDWTHTNAIVYSPDDRNIIVSIRHQSWVLKIDYDGGEGDGHILWTLGEGGTLKLVGGTDPTDWPYAQHGPGFFSPNTSGVFELGLMDNGDDRSYPNGSKCTPSGNLPASCLYSSVPVFKIDETAKTATLVFHQILPGNLYNFFGGNAEHLANGDVEYDLCGLNPIGSLVREVTMENDPQTVWSLSLQGNYFYRAFRIPSPYPGVQW